MYEVRTYPEADAAIEALPSAARAGYEDAVKVMGLVPWRGEPINKTLNPDGPVRQIVFGPDGAGFVVYLILDREREVHVAQVTWAG